MRVTFRGLTWDVATEGELLALTYWLQRAK